MKAALTEAQIKELEAKGFARWTKGDYDRLYVGLRELGCNPRERRFGDSSLSIVEARQASETKVWVDVKTGEICCRTRGPLSEDYFKHAVEEYIAKTPADYSKTLIGTDKQVAWAEEIRTNMIKVFEQALEELRQSPEDRSKHIERVEEWMAALKACRYASPIISLFGDVEFDKGFEKAFRRMGAVYRVRTPETKSQAILLCREIKDN